jgi:hypothetical protein
MKKQIVYDITNLNAAINSLGEYLNLSERQIVKYIAENKMTYNTTDFLDYFNIDDEILLDSELNLVALHVTTNNDKCESIKKYGLLNLQQAIIQDTPLSKYLKSQGVHIDIKQKEVHFRGKVYNIFKEYKGIRNRDRDFVPYKLYEDYQINSFLSYDNVLDYGVQNVPEFLQSLSNLLKSNDLQFNWIKQQSKCYVIKFVTSISNCANDTFYSGDDGSLNSNDFKYLDYEELVFMKRKWIVYQSLSVINNGIFADIDKQLYCPLNFDVKVPYSDILKIYTPSEYMKEYRLNN